jgi:MSHA biogenesis protein MshL
MQRISYKTGIAPNRFHLKNILWTGIVCAMVTGCAMPSTVETSPPFKPAPEKTIGLNNSGSSAAQGFTDYETTFSTDDVFVIKKTTSGDPLPELQLTNVNFTEQSVGEALNSVLTGTGIALVVRGGRKGDSDIYGSVTVTNLAGSLGDVMESISKNTGFFYSYNAKQKILTISPNRDFVIFMPPAIDSDTYTGMSNTMQSLGVHSVYQDVNGGTLKFTSNRDSLEKVQEYLDQIRDTRSLLVYDISIYKVQLTNGFKAGIAWSQIKDGVGGALTGGSALADGLSAAFTFSTGNLSQQVIPSLLQSYGNVTSVGNPRLVFLSGTSAYFRQGLNTTLVTNIGQNYGTSLNAVTVQTSNVKTGTEMGISAEVSDGTIYTRVTLKTSDIVSYTNFTALGTSLTLPTIGDNEFKSGVRSRIGDSVLLGGMIIDSASNSASGLPAKNDAISLPISKSDSNSRSELVLVLKPHLIRFKKQAAPTFSAAPATLPESKANVQTAPTVTAMTVAPNDLKAVVELPILTPSQEPTTGPVQQSSVDSTPAVVATAVEAGTTKVSNVATSPKATTAVSFIGRPGDDIRSVLRKWSALAGRELVWETTQNATLRTYVNEPEISLAMSGLFADLKKSSSKLLIIDLPPYPLYVGDNVQ